jgi:hypothetical protein
MPTATTPVAVIAACRGCETVTQIPDLTAAMNADETVNRMWQLYNSVACRGCGRQAHAEIVRGKRGKRECGSWCTEGTGRSCTCQCEGRNHGSTFQHTGALWAER